MQIESQRSRIFGSSNWTRRDKNGRSESERNVRIADTEVCQGHAKVLGIGELLLSIY